MERVDVADRWIVANTRAVWHALMDPAAREQWLPPAGMSGEIEGWQAGLGGGYRMTLSYDDAAAGGKSGPGQDIVDAEFTRLAPLQWVEETVTFVTDDPAYAGAMRVAWELRPAAGETYVRVTATDIPAGIGEPDHLAGLASSLAQLAAYLR